MSMSIRKLGLVALLWTLVLAGCPSGASRGDVTSTTDDAGTAHPDHEDGDAPPPHSGHGGSPAPRDDAGAPPAQGDGDGEPPAGSADHFFMPTGDPDNTAAPRVEVDAEGGVHAVYPAYAGGRAYYAYCQGDCGTGDMQVVRFDTATFVVNAMLALTSTGKPRVLLSTVDQIYFATCDADCGDTASWTTTMILDHDGNREVTGEALALDPQDRPRFVLHTYRAELGIGQKPPETLLASCDADCDTAEAWMFDVIQDRIWEASTLRYDATGRAHLATVATTFENGVPTQKLAAYLTCEGGRCATADDWHGIGLVAAFEIEYEAVAIEPAVSLALTHVGAPRVVVLAKDDAGARQIVYFACDEDCSEDHWQGSIISNNAAIGPGVDLALDAQDLPRFVYTLDYDIGLSHCDAQPCAGPDSTWDLTPVEHRASIPTDQIFLWENCHVATWTLHSPSIALDSHGEPRVGYQARDISGGLDNPDPTKPDCEAGTDMTWSRLALMSAHE
jgi:hypothetical protein